MDNGSASDVPDMGRGSADKVHRGSVESADLSDFKVRSGIDGKTIPVPFVSPINRQSSLVNRKSSPLTEQSIHVDE